MSEERLKKIEIAINKLSDRLDEMEIGILRSFDLWNYESMLQYRKTREKPGGL